MNFCSKQYSKKGQIIRTGNFCGVTSDQNKQLLKSNITGGSGSVSDVLQKLETGELEFDGEPIIQDNGDGTVTVTIKVKPR